MLGLVASVLVLVCKHMHQLPTMLGPTAHLRKDATNKTNLPCVMRERGPYSVGRVEQTDPILLHYASVITEVKTLTGFENLGINSQQHAPTCNRVCKPTQPLWRQQCCVRLHFARGVKIPMLWSLLSLTAILASLARVQFRYLQRHQEASWWGQRRFFLRRKTARNVHSWKRESILKQLDFYLLLCGKSLPSLLPRVGKNRINNQTTERKTH